MKIIRNIALLSLVLSFTACQDAPVARAISYTEALKKCEPVREEHVIKFDGNCLNGALLPDFSCTDMDGKTITNHDFKGKMRLLNFWFIECRPCIEEMPDLIALSQKWDSGDFEIISVCLNKREDVEKFLLKNSVPYAILPDSEQLADEVFQNPFGYPANFLIDQNGVIVDVFDALKEGNTDYRSLVQLVEHQHR